ncbi:adenylate/guanylate cyclase domain-containing protein [Aestuariispira insulae]|uniref:Adenylate/guanylate cyclase n=1 Tax=Aestuariispira insulae TaxID=1461337 RepID=A0A3D9HU16_9PROT|nr:adenylate/guanylate cyclase domain-containing protein [Aestuariispira insulae]RED52366.1 adenylate/guanylate cyclase [Aestuariispira insulae]
MTSIPTCPDLNTPVLSWLMADSFVGVTGEEFLRQLAGKLQESGVPIGRVAFFVRSLHPTIMGRVFRWDRKTGIEVNHGSYDILEKTVYTASPVYKIYYGEEKFIRRRIPECDTSEFPILEDLEEEGATDYMMYSLPFMNGEVHAVSFTSFDEGGFSDRDIELLKFCRLPLARIAEIYTLRRTASNLLETYLGRGTGERVLSGQIKRGDGERIEAVVCFSDLRRSSSLAEELGMEGFLQALNDFYDCTAAPIIENGGEVLRFIGDAYLGIFPLEQFGSEVAACQAALKAARTGINNLVERGDGWKAEGKPVLEGGFGLHIGEVMYGNIGTAERLEFTVIGATANEAARLESQCKNLSEPILVSKEFARRVELDWRDMGAFNARNISKPMHLYAPG